MVVTITAAMDGADTDTGAVTTAGAGAATTAVTGAIMVIMDIITVATTTAATAGDHRVETLKQASKTRAGADGLRPFLFIRR